MGTTHASVLNPPDDWRNGIACGPFASHDDASPLRLTPEEVVHPPSGLTMIRQGVSSPHRSVSSRARNPIFS